MTAVLAERYHGTLTADELAGATAAIEDALGLDPGPGRISRLVEALLAAAPEGSDR